MFKSILGLIGKAQTASNEFSGEPATDAIPDAGNIYCFRTSPFNQFSPPNTGRFAAFKVIGADDRFVAIAVLDGVWAEPPSLKGAAAKGILREHRFAHTGRLAVFGVNLTSWKPSELSEAFLLGWKQLSQEERGLAAKVANFAAGISYSTIGRVNYAAEGEWRWLHDREAVMAENAQEQALAAAQRAAEQERYRTRLSKLTWDKLLAETPFSNWSPSPPFPPESFTAAARETIHQTCRNLSELGPKPHKAEVRAVLKACVEWFNREDELAGGVIETEEREDICGVLEEIAFVAKQKSLVEEIDEWRDW
ncbi:hypothetical protein BH11PSE2_BH11PSE2_17450 [soil metagenome]